MKQIKVLDCTLRDGGYINDWNFGFDNINSIIKSLDIAKIDFIECGFLKNIKTSSDYTLFNNITDIKQIKTTNAIKTFMINNDEYDYSEIIKNDLTNFAFRIAFRIENLSEVCDFAKILKDKGAKVFINPKNFSTFSEKEITILINKINNLSPFAFSIVDTLGAMSKDDLQEKIKLINNLNKNIALCFHSHNNLSLSIKNTIEFIKLYSDYNLIIDSSIGGIGRGAGNLSTEYICKYLNENYQSKYNIDEIKKVKENIIEKFFMKISDKNMELYYLTAKMNCHPNYATFLIKNNIKSIDLAKELFALLPKNKKTSYDEKTINDLYMKLLINKAK